MIRHAHAALMTLAFACAPALATVVTFNFSLSGTQEVPPNGSAGTGTAEVTLDTATNLLTWNIAFSGLTTPATASHFHAPAAPGANAGVKLDIGALSGLTSPLIGSATIDNTLKQNFLDGLVYVNVHTSTFPGGEIRGQVVQSTPVLFKFTLDGLQEVPPNPSAGTGTATVTLNTTTNQLTWNIAYGGLFSSATASHFHAPAAPGANAGVKVDIGGISGLPSPMIGSTTIDSTLEGNFLSGLVYVNIHTGTFPGGEIRGQVVQSQVACCMGLEDCSDLLEAECMAAGGTPSEGTCATTECQPPATILVEGTSPPSGTIDARQPFPPTQPGVRQGIGSADEPITLNLGLAGIAADQFALCETAADPVLGPNDIAAVTDNGDGTYTIDLDHAITYNAVTTIEYLGDNSFVTYTSHPANTNGDAVAGASDILFVVNMLNGVSEPPFGIYSQDIDHSLLFGAPDILRTVDMLNGGAGYPVQNFSALPAADGCP